jgi:hypothetical protein
MASRNAEQHACEMARTSYAKFGMSSNAGGPKNGLSTPTPGDHEVVALGLRTGLRLLL